LLVGNLGGLGRTAAYDINTGTFIDYLWDGEGNPEEIGGVRGLTFGMVRAWVTPMRCVTPPDPTTRNTSFSVISGGAS